MRFYKSLLLVSMLFMVVGFSWVDQGKKNATPQEQGESINNNNLANAELVTSAVGEGKADNLQQISSEFGGSSEIVKPVLPKGFSSNRNFSYQGIREMTSAINAAKSAQSLVDSRILEQVAALNKDPEIVRIQKQINQVIKAHEQFKNLDLDQLKVLENVVQEVSNQREVLSKMSDPSNEKKLTKKDSEIILEQEKIRRQNS